MKKTMFAVAALAAFAAAPAVHAQSGFALKGSYVFNESSVHTDMMSTADRTVTAILRDGQEKVIYKDGMFQV